MRIRNCGSYIMFERLMIIQELIQNNPCTTKEKLQSSIKNQIGIEVSIPTLSRDLEFLRDRIHLPIEYDAQLRGYVWRESAK